MSIALLEPQLRHVPGVIYVGFGDLTTSLVVQVLTTATADAERVRAEAQALCESYLDRPFVVDVAGSSRPARIRLLHVEHGDDGRVIVHLGYDGLCAAGRSTSSGDDPEHAAEATCRALRALGATVPFAFEAAAQFEHAAGEGIMVVLDSETTGPRYGVASGKEPAVAAARATLDALNRHLSTQQLPTPGAAAPGSVPLPPP